MVRRDAAINRMEDPDAKVCKEAALAIKSTASRGDDCKACTAASHSLPSIARTIAGSKQARVIAMLQSPTGHDDRRDDEGKRAGSSIRCAASWLASCAKS